jgi:hypothetical protein
MNRFAAGDQRGGNDVGNAQVRSRDRPGPDAERFVRLSHVRRVAIGFGEDRDRPDAEFLTGAVDA